MNPNSLFWPDVIDFIGLTSIGLYIFLCMIFVSGFAVLHLTFPNGLPFFIGEACLLLGFILLIVKLIITRGWRLWHCLWAAYAVWILWATWCGTRNGTFLAFRHAALFYYAFFALLGYSFYNRRIFLSPLVYWPLLIMLILSLSVKLTAPYYYFSSVVLAMVLIFRLHSKGLRWILAASLVLWYFQFMFGGSRSHLAGSLAAVVFISTFLIFAIFNWKLRYRLIIFTGVLIFIGLGVKYFSDPNSVKSLTMPAELLQHYYKNKSFVDARKGSYVMPSFPVKLYDDNVDDRRVRSGSFSFLQNAASSGAVQVCHTIDANARVVQSSHPANANAGVVQSGHSTKTIPCVDQAGHSAKAGPMKMRNAPRELGNVYGNIMFRWYIWEDMWDDLVQTHSLWGVGFGKPQRSRSLEILNWGQSEWSRDGWIAPHNSYFHMIYRAGIIGVLIIIGMAMTFIHLLKFFMARHSVTGIFLLSILVYWMVMANFLVILELPYNAVLFWVLFGMTVAYTRSAENHERH